MTREVLSLIPFAIVATVLVWLLVVLFLTYAP